MKRMNVLAAAAALMLCTIAAGAVRDAQWQKVRDAMAKGLPKSAIEALDPILKSAVARGDHPEAVRALVQRVALEGAIQGSKPEEKIRRLQAEIAKAPPQSRPILEAVLARWFWEYFRENRWRFMQRTATDASSGDRVPSGDDFTAWDLPRIYAEIDTHFTRALAARTLLRRTPIAAWDVLLPRGNVPDAYRPTLYDFVAFEAIEFYASGEQAGARPEDAFVLSASGPIFAPAEEFIAWNAATTDSTAPAVRAVRLYQELLRFHAADRDPSARIDVDLARLRYGKNVAVGEGKGARYQEALRRIAERWPHHELSARALADWAGAVREQGDLVEARRIASLGHERFPNSAGGRACWNLIQEIEQKALSFETERVWSEPPPVIRVRYRNLDQVHFRIVPFDFHAWVANRDRRSQVPQGSELDALLRRRPEREWSETLPATPDYRERTEKLPTPDNLPSGSYYLIASNTGTFQRKDGPIHVAVVWVSNLALVLRNDNGALEGFVLNAENGSPLPNARIRAWYRQYSNAVQVAYTMTDSAGRFRVSGGPNQHHIVLASFADQRLASQEDFGTYHGDPAVPDKRTLFFTDRALYRPGQTIHYKALCIAVDTERGRYETLRAESVTVVLRDANGQEVERTRHRTNDYGSCSGTFTAPQGRLLGMMTLRADSPPGAATVSVEEYKRPKFAVSFGGPTGSPRLGGPVSIVGTATAYTGASIDGARVSWHVMRQARYADWWYPWRWAGIRSNESQNIAHGTTVTHGDGTFEVTFTAQPDSAYERKGQPVFVYTVHADVVDPTGETRSADRSVRVGYTEFDASLSADAWLVHDRPFAFSLHTATLDGVALPVRGTFTLHRLREPARVGRPSLPGYQGYYDESYLDVSEPSPREDGPESDDPARWPDDMLVRTQKVATDSRGWAKIDAQVVEGAYRAAFEARDGAGNLVRAEYVVRVVNPDAPRCGLPLPFVLDAPAWTVEPGEEFLALWGSGYDGARAFVEVEHHGKLLQSFWTSPERTQVAIRQRVTEDMRGGFTLRVLMVYENRAHIHERHVDVPWTNKQLNLRWERFVSKLEPGSRATWTAVVTGRDATAAVAEMVATLYDASLDAFRPHAWPRGFGVFRQGYASRSPRFENARIPLQPVGGQWPSSQQDASIQHRRFPDEVLWYWAQHGGRMWGGIAMSPGVDNFLVRAVKSLSIRGGGSGETALDMASGIVANQEERTRAPDIAIPTDTPRLDAVTPRRNLSETAFFFPHLISNSRGEVRMSFTLPEALTRWHFMGFAHDSKLRSGLLEGSAVTSLDFMVQPNPPRFLREGDELEFTVKITNQSDARQRGQARLTFTDAETGVSRDLALGNRDAEQPFDVPPRESRTFGWKLVVPDSAGVLAYKAVASTGRQSDGEEGALPVLSRSILVTESLPLPIRGPGSRTFDFASLRESGASPTLRHSSFTVQMVSNPSWYAVMALPYLMEYPYECSEQTFNRLYANALARHIATSQPRIRRVFEQWKGTAALDSPLEKNQELKAVVLEESPWVRQAQSESRARRNVAILFDAHRLDGEIARAQQRLADLQLGDGAWPWFPGGYANEYITLYITTGFGRLRHLGVAVDLNPALRSLDRLDGWADRMYRDVLRHGNKDQNHLSTTVALYLYGRSFFLKDRPVPESAREAVDYWRAQARHYWLELPGRQSQAHVALALNRFGDKETPLAIMRSLRERAVTSEEMGMFWREDEYSWWWYRAPIETQAVVIEAFDEVANDSAAVEDCKVWLLKQKQTQDWKTTKATADAVYALLLRGTNSLASETLVEVALGGQRVQAEAVEAGTGFYEHRYAGAEITPALADITVKKTDVGVAWGSVHWQYFEDMSRVRDYRGTPLTLKKALYVRDTGARGAALRAVNGPVRVGDELVVRLELRVDRDMEYVHLKDYRGSGVEPVNVLSGYRYQDGLAYYEQTRDAASHFFIDYLPKGTYVFEYSTRVQHRGRYQTGIAQIQCMYAPEFNSHSGSVALDVR